MSMTDREWREFDRDARRGGSRMALILIIVFLFVAALGAGGWALKVATSDIKGQGDSIITKNSSENRIKAQEAYVSALNEVKRADKQLDILAATKNDSPNAKTRYVGGISYCQSMIADYNALGEKYRSADFRPTGYPLTIDEADTATDCKEN